MTDMTKAIAPKSDQLNSDDLIGCTKDIKITAVNISSTEQPVSVRFEGDNGKPFKPCKSMCRVMVQCWGADANQYIGRTMRLYRDPEVTWAGMKVGGIRISHVSHIDKPITMALTASKQKRALYTVEPLKTAPASQEAAEPKVIEGLKSDINSSDEAGLKLIAEKLKQTTMSDEQKSVLRSVYSARLEILKQPVEPEENIVDISEDIESETEEEELPI